MNVIRPVAKYVLLICVATLAWVYSGETRAYGSEEERFPVLKIGSHTYTNVTVTTKAADYIFILHDSGMNNIRVADLPLELRDKFGYNQPPPAPAETKASRWAKAGAAQINSAEMAAMRQDLVQNLRAQGFDPAAVRALVSPKIIAAVLGGLLMFYLFVCSCCMLICRKAGHPGGLLVWLPILQVFPLVRAAGMSYWWAVGWFIPFWNIVAQILWCLRIVAARGKSVVWAILLMLPATNLLALMYLAFSSGSPPAPSERKQERVELMTLETT